MIDFDFKSGTKEIRQFALVLPLALVVWGLILGFKHHWGGQSHFWFFGVALLIFLWGRLSPSSLKPLYTVWMYFTRVLGWLITTLVLGLVFYLGFTLTGLVFRLLGKDPLHRKVDRKASSYWIKRPPYHFDREHYERQF